MISDKLEEDLIEFLDRNAKEVMENSEEVVKGIGEILAYYLGDSEVQWLSPLKDGYMAGVESFQDDLEWGEEDEFEFEDEEEFDSESDLQSDLDRTHAHQRGETLEDEDWNEEIV